MEREPHGDYFSTTLFSMTASSLCEERFFLAGLAALDLACVANARATAAVTAMSTFLATGTAVTFVTVST
jgi:hypothetical protein